MAGASREVRSRGRSVHCGPQKPAGVMPLQCVRACDHSKSLAPAHAPLIQVDAFDNLAESQARLALPLDMGFNSGQLVRTRTPAHASRLHKAFAVVMCAPLQQQARSVGKINLTPNPWLHSWRRSGRLTRRRAAGCGCWAAPTPPWTCTALTASHARARAPLCLARATARRRGDRVVGASRRYGSQGAAWRVCLWGMQHLPSFCARHIHCTAAPACMQAAGGGCARVHERPARRAAPPGLLHHACDA